MPEVLKNVTLYLVIIIYFVLTSCTTEPDRFNYTVVVTNLSGNALEISLFSERQLVEYMNLESNQQFDCHYNAENFQGIYGCLDSNRTGIDSIRLVFENGSGYVCTDFVNSNELCFLDQRFLFADQVSGGFIDNGDNQFELVLSPNDFLNAFNLEE